MSDRREEDELLSDDSPGHVNKCAPFSKSTEIGFISGTSEEDAMKFVNFTNLIRRNRSNSLNHKRAASQLRIIQISRDLKLYFWSDCSGDPIDSYVIYQFIHN